MDPNVWGKHMWASIHFIATAYPDEPTEADKLTYHTFYTNLYKVLPCHTCRDHLKATLENEIPLHANFLKNKEELFKWTVNLHNVVNKRLKKKVITLEEAYTIIMKRDKFNEAMCGKQIDTSKCEVSVSNSDEPLFSNIVVMFLLVLAMLSIVANIYYVVFVRKFKF
jgi:hypothetical protein